MTYTSVTFSHGYIMAFFLLLHMCNNSLITVNFTKLNIVNFILLNAGFCSIPFKSVGLYSGRHLSYLRSSLILLKLVFKLFYSSSRIDFIQRFI